MYSGMNFGMRSRIQINFGSHIVLFPHDTTDAESILY